MSKKSEALKAHRQRKKEWLNNLKGNTCQDCGGEFPSYCLDYHHRERSTKEFHLGKLYSRSKEKILEEIKKCDVICANCHRIREHADVVQRQNISLPTRGSRVQIPSSAYIGQKEREQQSIDLKRKVLYLRQKTLTHKEIAEVLNIDRVYVTKILSNVGL